MVTVYSKPSCGQCVATERALKRNGVSYNKIDVTQDVVAYNKVLESGHMSMPYVEAIQPDGSLASWSGFDPEKITALAWI